MTLVYFEGLAGYNSIIC